MRLKDPPLLAATVAGCGGVGLAGHLNASPEIIWIFQPLTIGLITWAAWRRGVLASHYAQFVTLGLALATLGDTVRLIPDQMLISTGLLVLTCLSYLWAFTAECPLNLNAWPVRIAVLMALPFAILLAPALPVSHLVPAVTGLMLGSMMTGQAVVRSRSLRGRDRALANRSVLGAALLLAAMMLMFTSRYLQPVPLAIVLQMVPYWAGQVLIASSIAERQPDSTTVG